MVATFFIFQFLIHVAPAKDPETKVKRRRLHLPHLVSGGRLLPERAIGILLGFSGSRELYLLGGFAPAEGHPMNVFSCGLTLLHILGIQERGDLTV
jgi:hypothetical protein